MRFETGNLYQYSTLRNQKPSVYYLEEFYYKALTINVDNNYKCYINNIEIDDSEPIVTVNFPEFLDVSSNLDLIKSIHFAYDFTINKVGEFIDSGLGRVKNLVHPGYEINDTVSPKQIFTNMKYAPYPDDMIKLYLGYRHVAVKDPNAYLEDADSLCCKELVEMEDDCFTWIQITDKNTINAKTDRPTVCKFKIEFLRDAFLDWLNTTLPEKNIGAFLDALGTPTADFNLILHPPYMGRMSFKDNIKIVYPLQKVTLKTIDKIIFRANKSYTVNNKIYIISFIDKDTGQILFTFNSIDNGVLFTNIKQVVDTSNVNSYITEELITFDDGMLVNFEVPNPVQIALSKHNNYKINIVAKDLTTQDRG